MSEFITVAKVGDIPEGEGRAYEYDEQMVAVFNDKGEYRAIDDMCPHMGASLASGHLEDGVVACPWHSWRFDTRDGAWCENRRLTIDVFQVRVVGDEIQIAAAEKPADDSKIKEPDSEGGSESGGCSSCNSNKAVERADETSNEEISSEDDSK
jgi:nitrite reductase (NADH) small subunit/3-phenylpropionate/trans-cinnamate dioxygenase ferredoxin subunit